MDDLTASFRHLPATALPLRQVFVTISAPSLDQLEQRLSEMGDQGFVQIGSVVSSRAVSSGEEFLCLMSRRVR